MRYERNEIIKAAVIVLISIGLIIFFLVAYSTGTDYPARLFCWRFPDICTK